MSDLTQSKYDLAMQADQEARLHHGRFRSMRVTLECGHYRLMPKIDTIMGIGAKTGCGICSPESPGAVGRTVVNVEETGVLHGDFYKRGEYAALCQPDPDE